LLHYGPRNCRCCYFFYKRINVSVVVFRKQSALQEAEEPKPEAKEKPMPVSNLTEGLGDIQAGLRVSEDMIRKSGEEVQRNTGLREYLLALRR